MMDLKKLIFSSVITLGLFASQGCSAEPSDKSQAQVDPAMDTQTMDAKNESLSVAPAALHEEASMPVAVTESAEATSEEDGQTAPQMLAGNATAGATVFKKKCRACHSNIEGKKKVGPSLYGVVGRTPGTLTGYKYSPAMRGFGASGAVWDAANLNTYLESPRGMLPKVKMIFPGLTDAQNRADIIAYLDALDAN